MLTSDERLAIGKKVLERFKLSDAVRIEHSPRQRPIRPSPFPHTGSRPVRVELDTESSPSQALPVKGDERQLRSMADVLAQTGPLPPQSVLLGICEDELPFLFDLTNPAPGSLLVVGDAGSGKVRLVKSILASARRLSKPDQMTFSLITVNASSYQEEMQALEYCQHFISPEETSAAKLIENLANQAENRRRSMTPGRVVLLVVDDLAACLQSLDHEQFRRFYWLIKHGPRSRIWVLATLDPASLAWLDMRILDAFRTRIMGLVADAELAVSLAGDERFSTLALESGEQFCVPFGDDWLRFWICDPE